MEETKGVAQSSFTRCKMEEWKRVSAEAMEIVRATEDIGSRARGERCHDI
jgi:hypothetical protein